MGLPPTSAPLTPGLNFATINAETLEAAQQEMEFKVPEEKVIDKVRLLRRLPLLVVVWKARALDPALLCMSEPAGCLQQCVCNSTTGHLGAAFAGTVSTRLNPSRMGPDAGLGGNMLSAAGALHGE